MAESIEGRETDRPLVLAAAFLRIWVDAIPRPLMDGHIPEPVVCPEFDVGLNIAEVVQDCVAFFG